MQLFDHIGRPADDGFLNQLMGKLAVVLDDGGDFYRT